MKIYLKRFSKVALTAIILLASNSNSHANDCERLMAEADEKFTTIRAKQTGGFKEAADEAARRQSGQESPLDIEKAELKTLFSEANRKGCPVDPKWVPREVKTNSGQEIQSQFTPAAQGPQEAPSDNTFQKLLDIPFDPLTSIKIETTSPISNAPDYFKPPKEGTPKPKLCGEIAAEFVSSAWQLSKQRKVKFKDDCSGTDSVNVPRASPNKPSTECSGTEFGNFGLIHSAYHNKKQLISVADLYTKTPSQASAENIETVAFNNMQTGEKKELNGCRLSTIKGSRNCGKLGDIIMLKTKPNEPDNKAYDKFLILGSGYDFYEAQDSESEPIRRGSLKPEYNSMTYEIRRFACNNGIAAPAKPATPTTDNPPNGSVR